MEDSMKSFVVAMTLAGLFITSIISFITLFPQEQGVVFTDDPSNSSYLAIKNIDVGTNSNLQTIDNSTKTGFDQWDITQGFMGSNTMKQSSSSGVKSTFTNLIGTIKIMATQLFGSNSPIMYVILVLTTLGGIYIIYVVYQFIRTGR